MFRSACEKYLLISCFGSNLSYCLPPGWYRIYWIFIPHLLNFFPLLKVMAPKDPCENFWIRCQPANCVCSMWNLMGDTLCYSHGVRATAAGWPGWAGWGAMAPSAAGSPPVGDSNPGADSPPAPTVGGIPDGTTVCERLLQRRLSLPGDDVGLGLRLTRGVRGSLLCSCRPLRPPGFGPGEGGGGTGQEACEGGSRLHLLARDGVRAAGGGGEGYVQELGRWRAPGPDPPLLPPQGEPAGQDHHRRLLRGATVRPLPCYGTVRPLCR